MPDKLVKVLSTFFFVGYFPWAPGSMASLLGLGLCIALRESLFVYICLFAFITILGLKLSARMEALVKKKDPSCIVIDEVAGAMIAFFLLPVNLPVMLTAYFLFRAFDMFKIYPVNRLEELEGGAGIMFDDLVAGLYTNIVMHVALRLVGF